MHYLKCISQYAATPTCEERLIRLMNGSQPAALEGHIEICINNQWGAICNEGWSDYDAAVACRQLGISTNTPRGIWQGTAYLFGQGNAPILISNVNCSGNEGAITNCPFNFLHNCLPSQIAGVQCTS